MKKKFMLILALFMIGCSNISKNTLIDEPLYTREGLTYSVTTDNPITGIVLKEEYHKHHIYTYEDGVLINKKVLSYDRKLDSERNYNKYGLLHGEIYLQEGESILSYQNGILNGISKQSDYSMKQERNYKDGTLHGRHYTNSDYNQKELFFSNGVISLVEVENSRDYIGEDIVWGEAPKDYSGILYSEVDLMEYRKLRQWSRSLPVLQKSLYKSGEVLEVSYYDEEGLKLSHYEFYNRDKSSLKSKTIYEEGLVSESMVLDKKRIPVGRGVLEISEIGGSNAQNIYTTFVKGIPHGEAKNIIIDKDSLEEERYYYNKGMKNGRVSEEFSLIDGEVVERVSNHTVKPLEVVDIEDIKDLKTFTGYAFKGAIEKRLILDTYELIKYIDGEKRERYVYYDNILNYLEIYGKEESIRKYYSNGLYIMEEAVN